MKITVTESIFIDQFKAIRPDNFSYEGLELLFSMLEESEDSTGEQIELDVIAICCDYSESTADELINNYDIEIDDNDDELEIIEEFLTLIKQFRPKANDNTHSIIIWGEKDSLDKLQIERMAGLLTRLLNNIKKN